MYCTCDDTLPADSPTIVNILILIRYISVEAEVQRPGLCLDHCQVHLENVYVGIPHTLKVLLKNTYLIPAHFTWSSQVYKFGNVIGAKPHTRELDVKRIVDNLFNHSFV